MPWTICPVSIDHYENFPVASLLCPARLRPPITAIYRFARCADDIADEGQATPTQRLATIEAYVHALDRAVQGLPATRWPEVFDPLTKAIATFNLPAHLLHDLLDAFAQDCTNPCYSDRQQLLDYCRRSANPIGRLLLHLYAVNDELALSRSDAICTALQLVNFWQDASVDLARGRNYFPLQDLRRHNLAHDTLQAGSDTPSTQAVLQGLCAWTRGLMLQGSPLVDRLPGRIGWELRLVVQGGVRILDKIHALRYRSLSRRPTLNALDLPAMLWLAARMPSLPQRHPEPTA